MREQQPIRNSNVNSTQPFSRINKSEVPANRQQSDAKIWNTPLDTGGDVTPPTIVFGLTGR